MTNIKGDSKRLFSKDTLTKKELSYIKQNIDSNNFVDWLMSEYDALRCYHAGRPTDIKTYYDRGFVPTNFQEAQTSFANFLKSINCNVVYDLQEIIESFTGYSDKEICFILDKEDYFDVCPHYLIYGSELMLCFAQKVSPYIKDHLRERGIPTIFHCEIPLRNIAYSELHHLHEKIGRSKGTLKQSLNQIFSNYTIVVKDNLSSKYIVGHEHPTRPLIDYHRGGITYINTAKVCPFCLGR